MLSTMSLKTSLTSAFALLLVLLLLQGGFALSSMRGIFTNVDGLANDAVPAVDITNRLNISIANLRGLQTRHILTVEPAALEEADAVLAKEVKKLQDRMATYEPMISLDEERTAFDGFKRAAADYLVLHERLVALSRAGKKQEAAALLSGEMVRSYEEMDGFADSFRDANVKAAEMMYAESASEFTLSLIKNIVLVTIGALAGIAAMVFVSRDVSRPIERITDIMRRLAKGDLTVKVPYLGRSNEIGDMAKAVAVFQENGLRVEKLNAEEQHFGQKCDELRDAIGQVVAAAVEGDFSQRMTRDFEFADLNAFAASMNELVETIDSGLRETRRVMQALADGDLTDSMRGQFTGAFAELQNNVNATMNTLRSIVTEVRQSIDQINGGSGELRFASDDLAKRTEQQAAALEETSSALEEITTAVRQSTDRATAATLKVDEARQSTEISSVVVGDAIAAMQRIEQASGQISQIINVIDEIAFQTNLLALNAGVEAARAGEAGKGFAVVAQEVRELAQRSAGAAKDIKALITKSGEEVDAGVKLVTATGEALAGIRGHVEGINREVHEIASTSKEQSTRLQEVNATVGQMDQVTQRNAAMVEETTASTNRLAEDAHNLARLISRFKLDPAGIRREAPPIQAANSRVTHRPALKVAGGGSRDSWQEF
ncbi:HAMP domain-containing methyl-accepting chemotaxis protein [Rhizobium sp. SL86]|uniref:HAMP domain-containing methyl-accepting chemotaxis protein n=1 Tax=Rhizobium sp. SL86 TaxID=2995148 RepID=UPI002273DDFF|nr:methyl-accepting chemotaxis protein [Rhizobium sp. SL86]MCY1664015.1 methyl-accepting chemotaxis protein [Rhizobium sp. SL86]